MFKNSFKRKGLSLMMADTLFEGMPASAEIALAKAAGYTGRQLQKINKEAEG